MFTFDQVEQLEIVTNAARPATQEERRLSVEERQSLRRVPGKIPRAVWLISLSTLLERYAYYAFMGPLRKSS